ncbi:MAG TPA: hypothetical protein VGH56_06185 [Solirubrobacteraceae bacterium]
MPGDENPLSDPHEQRAADGSEQRASGGSEQRPADAGSLKGRVTKQSEEAIGKLAQELLENSVVSSALAAAFGTRERALRAQEAALAALNIPSASDIERLTRRVRSVSQRLEGIEDGLDRVESRLDRRSDIKALEERLERIEAALERLQGAGVASEPEA